MFCQHSFDLIYLAFTWKFLLVISSELRWYCFPVDVGAFKKLQKHIEMLRLLFFKNRNEILYTNLITFKLDVEYLLDMFEIFYGDLNLMKIKPIKQNLGSDKYSHFSRLSAVCKTRFTYLPLTLMLIV